MYGLRSSEITELRLKDIDWRNSVIHLRRAKGCRPQVMPLIDEVAQPLLRYILEGSSKVSEAGVCVPYYPSSIPRYMYINSLPSGK